MSAYKAEIGAKLGISGTLEFRDAQGNVLKTVEMSGAIPLEQLGMTIEQAEQLIKENQHGPDHR
jgi:hypothetical protein